ncbi:MAG: DUF2637 domain-containing protein [Mycobacterium sp.]|nr:DUF2637 domain-containing protein [Mycobacterium sp.]
MNPTPTAAELIARHHRRAVTFFWGWLVGATLTSLAGNITHALLTAPHNLRWVATVVAAVPPTVLLMAVHGVAVLVKANASGVMYKVSVAATGVLALGAFLLSFVALRALAVLAGIAPALAAVLPLVVDLAVAVATAALVAVGDKPARRPRNAALAATYGAVQSRTPTATLGRANARSDRAVPASADAVSATTRASNDAAIELAAHLVSSKVTRQPVATVEAILVAHHNGDPLNRIAANLGVHHSAVKRVLDAAEAISERQLLAAS